MASGPFHYREAERLADAYKQAVSDVEAMPNATTDQRLSQSLRASLANALLSKASVHATLAVAAAIHDRETGTSVQLHADEWQETLR